MPERNGLQGQVKVEVRVAWWHRQTIGYSTQRNIIKVMSAAAQAHLSKSEYQCKVYIVQYFSSTRKTHKLLPSTQGDIFYLLILINYRLRNP